MYGKHFASMYVGSMVGSGACVFAVWGYVIAHAQDARVELNPRLLAAILGESIDSVTKAIEILSAPDPESRSKTHEGRRLVREGQFQYFLPTWESYREIRKEDDRREYNRLKKREERERRRNVKNVNDKSDSQQKSAMSANTEAESEAESEASPKSPSPKQSKSTEKAQKNSGGRFDPFIAAIEGLPPLPESLNTPEVKRAWLDWLQLCFDRNQQVRPIGARNTFQRFHDRPRDFAAAINYSIANDYKGIIEEKKNGSPTPAKPQKKTTIDKPEGF